MTRGNERHLSPFKNDVMFNVQNFKFTGFLVGKKSRFQRCMIQEE